MDIKSFLVVLLLVFNGAAHAAGTCPSGGDKAFDSLLADLHAAKTCAAASARLHECAWGSSADTSFAPPVVARCEKDFFARLSPEDQRDYERQMQRCAYNYAANQGTLFMSQAALCQVDVATSFARDPKAALRPGRASFDCAKASRPLEHLICSNDSLGQADIILAEDYKAVLASAEGDDKAALVESEKRWLEALPAVCHVAGKPTPAAAACVTRAVEKRFTALNQCQNETPETCLDKPDEDTVGGGPRASFDCQGPQTAMEIAICADAGLGQADIKLAAAYRAALDASADGHDALVASERQWLRRVGAACPLGAIGGIPPVFGRSCVRAAFAARAQQLDECARKPVAARAACLAEFRFLPKS